MCFYYCFHVAAGRGPKPIEMPECVECDEKIARGSESVNCAGECKKSWHISCAGLTKSGVHAMSENSVLLYVCFNCRKNMHGKNQSKTTRESETAENVMRVSDECVKRMEAACKQVVCEEFTVMTKKIMDIVENKISEIIQREISHINNNFQSELKEIRENLCTPIHNNWAQVVRSGTICKQNRDQTPIISKRVSEDVGGILRSGKRRRIGKHNDELNGETIQITQQIPDIRVEEAEQHKSKIIETIIFKPKIVQSVDKTKNDIRHSLNAVTSGVKSVRYSELTGEAFIKCVTKQKSIEFLANAQKVLGDKYLIEMREPNKPRIRVVGFEKDDEDNDGNIFINNLIAQNGIHDKAEIKIVKTFENGKWKNSSMVAILEVDAVTFETIMKKKRVNIGWDRCKVFEEISVLRCYKCWSYGHKIAECKDQVCCPRCAEHHEIKECEVSYEKCINCEKFNRKMNLGADKQLDVCHAAWSYECEIFKKKQINAKRFIDYRK